MNLVCLNKRRNQRRLGVRTTSKDPHTFEVFEGPSEIFKRLAFCIILSKIKMKPHTYKIPKDSGNLCYATDWNTSLKGTKNTLYTEQFFLN